MIVAVTGGRDRYDLEALVFATLDELKPELVIHGGAHGVDALADRWSLSRETHACQVDAFWTIHGPSAGPRRNRAMMKLKPDLLVAFPGGRGTADCVRAAEEAGIQVRMVREP